MDIEIFGSALSTIWNGLATPMTVYGFTFSFRDVLMFSLVSTVIFTAISKIFND